MSDPSSTTGRPVDRNLQTWLQRREWERLKQHFAAVSPVHAEEFEARALTTMALQPGPDGARRALADLHRACTLQPGNVLSAANLMQALIDAGDTAEALRLTTDAMRQAPQIVALAEKHAWALVAAAKWDDAQLAAAHAISAAHAAGATPTPTMTLLVHELSSHWWLPQILGDIVLRLPAEVHRDFVVRCFGAHDFITRYRRFQSNDADAVRAFLDLARRRPRQSGRLDWIVCRGDDPIGLASLSDLDFTHHRGELLIGLLRPDASAASALKASLAAIDFGFNGLGLRKLVSCVYGDNASAQANTLHLGLRQEGLLRSHLLTPAGPLDLYLNGLLAEEYRADARLQRMIARWRIADTIPTRAGSTSASTVNQVEPRDGGSGALDECSPTER